MHHIRVACQKRRYTSRFNMPRYSRHALSHHYFVPTHWLHKALEPVTVMRPFLDADLVHTFNSIPLGTKPFVVTFESNYPRYTWGDRGALWRFYCGLASSERCRHLIAMSQHAKDTFLRETAGVAQRFEAIPVSVVYPSIDVQERPKTFQTKIAPPLKLFFVGAEFARKGGCVAVRVAEKALKLAMPIEVTVVSSLTVGKSVYTDPWSDDFFSRYVSLLDLPNVTYFKHLPNDEVLEFMSRSDLTLLPTFSDTFGFSVIESMSRGVPAVVTDRGALSEFIDGKVNGIVVPLDTDEAGRWTHLSWPDKGDEEYQNLYAAEIERMSDVIIEQCDNVLTTPGLLQSMGAGCHETARELFCARKNSAIVDRIYEDVVCGLAH